MMFSAIIASISPKSIFLLNVTIGICVAVVIAYAVFAQLKKGRNVDHESNGA